MPRGIISSFRVDYAKRSELRGGGGFQDYLDRVEVQIGTTTHTHLHV